MHDPSSLAFDIYLGPKQKSNGHYRTPFISIWHCDPETDGSDDSCGWFIRSRHIDPKLYEKVKKEFAFNFKHEYWFNNGGYPKFSVPGIVLNLYNTAAWQVFMYLNDGKPDRKRHDRFMKKHLFDILYFAENPVDSMYDSITMKYGVEYTSARIDHFTSIVLADIMRKLRPWYKHPRWHIHHWEINFPLFRQFYRRWFERCDRCKGKIGTQSVYTDWNGTEHWCNACNDKTHSRLSKPLADKS
jgi:hypothetical protein